MGPDRAVQEELRRLPSVDALLHVPAVEAVLEAGGRSLAVDAIRAVLDEAREAILEGEACPPEDVLVQHAVGKLHSLVRPTLHPVINATGVVIHTNLGRVTGAEAALVVNNNAGAVLLALSALARGHEVVISRGQLIEIGGGFRIPDVMRQSGARLVEVGTTNRTHLRDYEQAIGPETAMLMVAHQSNFRVSGFTAAVPARDLVDLAHAHDLIAFEDLGSGTLLDTQAYGFSKEPTAQAAIADGIDLVSFSGDKLLGAPQAGILVGRAALVARLRHHPLTRALRVDKTTLAGLQATLLHYLKGDAERTVPVWRLIAQPPEELGRRAHGWATRLHEAGLDARVIDGRSAAGGGSLPGETVPTRLLAIDTPSPDRAAARLRAHDPPVIVRIEQDLLCLDPRTVLPDQEALLLDALLSVLGGLPPST